MLLTITTTHEPATDLCYLLHKNPSRTQSFELSFGKAHVLYPEATPERCTAALVLEIDPIGLVQRKEGAAPLEQYAGPVHAAASAAGIEGSRWVCPCLCHCNGSASATRANADCGRR